MASADEKAPVADLDSNRPHDAEKGAAPTSAADKDNTLATQDSSEPKDENVVDWDGDDDPDNPRNWTSKAKAYNTSLIIILCFVTPLGSSMFAPGVPDVLKTFETDSVTIAEFVVSIYILGFAVGPLLISPLSEIYGRYPVYVVCNIFYIIFTVACAVSSSMAQLVVFRFFAGAFGVCPVTLGGASISDLIPQEKRGGAIALFGVGPLLGPVVGPIAGAYLSAAKGWRWTFWVIAIAYGVFTIIHAALCRETYAPVLLARRTAALKKSTGNNDLRSKLDSGLPNTTYISRAFVRPFKMLIFSPIVLLMSLYVAFAYGILYLLFTTFTFVFTRYYGFTQANVGLTFIGSGIGMFIGLFVIGGTSDRILKKLTAKNGGEMKPEYRLVVLMYASPFVPIGLFIYGWTAQYHEQWAIPLFGTLLFGFGIIGALICIQQYLIDAFTIYAASAVAANTVLRSIVGGLLPLAGLSMYDKLGLGWGNSLIAFIALAMTPIPFIFYKFGERIRKKTPVSL